MESELVYFLKLIANEDNWDEIRSYEDNTPYYNWVVIWKGEEDIRILADKLLQEYNYKPTREEVGDV